MKFIVTIPPQIKMNGKKPTILPYQHFVTEAFNQAQAERRAKTFMATHRGVTIGPLTDWIEAIPPLP